MDDTDGYLICACLLLLGLAVVIQERRTEKRLAHLEQEAQFLRIVVTTTDAKHGD